MTVYFGTGVKVIGAYTGPSNLAVLRGNGAVQIDRQNPASTPVRVVKQTAYGSIVDPTNKVNVTVNTDILRNVTASGDVRLEFTGLPSGEVGAGISIWPAQRPDPIQPGKVNIVDVVALEAGQTFPLPTTGLWEYKLKHTSYLAGGASRRGTVNALEQPANLDLYVVVDGAATKFAELRGMARDTFPEVSIRWGLPK